MTCKSSALCLFDDNDVQMDIVSTNKSTYYPKTSINITNPIEFVVPPTDDEYIDLGDMQLLLHLQITKKDGTALAAADLVSFINQPISSCFQDVFLTIADKDVEGGQHLYGYNGYLSSLLQFHPSAKKTHMVAWGWQEDTPDKFADLSGVNVGQALRMKETAEGKVWEIMGPLFLDMMRQPRYLLPQTNLKLKLLPAKPEFVLIGDGNKYTYKILKCELIVPRVSVMNTVISGHNKGLEKFNAKYPLNHIDITNFTITKENQSFIKDTLFPTQVPKLLVVGLLDHDSFNGHIKKNPFNFENFDLNKIALYRDGTLIPGQIYTPNYDKEHFLRAYNNTMSSLNYFNTDDSNGMTLEHFKDGYNLYAFDLTPDGTAQGPHRHLMRTGSLRLELSFAKLLPHAITVLLFAVFDAKVEITKMRELSTTYNR